MNGLYVIIIVFVVTVLYTIKYFQTQKVTPPASTEQRESLVRIVPYIKWIPIILCTGSTFLLKREISWATKLSGAKQAQADFGIFWVFAVYVVPSILLVILSVYFHIKYDKKQKYSLVKVITDPFVIYAFLIIILPLYFFWCR
jgi:hypothetical protein